ncbi:MAG TPA: AccI family restriction endonuclease [Candidatus Desulfofervidus auxilii]|uniref:AccI family restriction endonuclease n=1 Tax=Desulfofervidus auxilii TaxID=1621989 RepID=A0A7C0YBP6_DESA2|nr:AccI family restriction endonuclease [Candidatus Desulfofervidus auxilii]
MPEEFPCIKCEPIKLPRPPARATEAFLSTIAQGMWAEEKLMEAINSTSQLIAIKYGQSRYNHELISNKEAWKKYVTKVYSQMSKFGKRPDILIFGEKIYQQIYLKILVKETRRRLKILYLNQ